MYLFQVFICLCFGFYALHTTVCGYPKVAILSTNFHTENCRSKINKTDLRSTSPPLAGRCCYRQWFCLSWQCPPCFQRFSQSVYLSRKTIFCLSAMSGRERFNFCEAREFLLSYRAFAFGISFCLRVGFSSLPPAGTRTAMC